MLNTEQIIEALQWEDLQALDPVHDNPDQTYLIFYEFADGEQPDDLWETYDHWDELCEDERSAVRSALDHIESLINVEFVEVSDFSNPDLNIGSADLPPGVAGRGGTSYTYIEATGDIIQYEMMSLFDTSQDISSNPSLILHELGHALGLKHPFEGATLPEPYENNKYTLMSYTLNPDTGQDGDVFQVFDILALQELWGAAQTATGDDVYTGPRSATTDAIWDAGGVDLFDASADPDGVVLDLREGAYSQFGDHEDVAIAFGTVIENAIGSEFDDMIFGNEARNDLKGGGLNDTLYGGKGRDTVEGGGGQDTLRGGGSSDWLFGQGGRDTLRGERGNDKLEGGGGKDTFIFETDGGRDKILDFEDGMDTIDLRDFAFADLDTALAHAEEVDGDVVFTIGDDVLTVLDTLKADLSDDLLL